MMSQPCQVCGWSSVKDIKDLYKEDVDGDLIEFGDKVAILIQAEVIWIPNESFSLYLNCNDVFFWGCADTEVIQPSDIEDLFEWWIQDEKWGEIKFACKKRNMQPQIPIVEDIKKDGKWEGWMDDLETANHNHKTTK